MQPTVPFAIGLYLGSYFPLALILVAQDLRLDAFKDGFCSIHSLVAFDCATPFRNTIWSMSGVAVCAIGLLVTIVALRKLPMRQRVKIVETKHIPADLINYVIPYIVSFVSLDFSDSAKLIGFGVFFVWIFIITYKSGQLALNPVLAVLGWKLFEVKYTYHGAQDIFVGRMLSKNDIEPNQLYLQTPLQDVMIVRGDAEGRA